MYIHILIKYIYHGLPYIFQSEKKTKKHSLRSEFKDLNTRSGLGEVLVHHHVHVLRHEKLFPICLQQDLTSRKNFLQSHNFFKDSKTWSMNQWSIYFIVISWSSYHMFIIIQPELFDPFHPFNPLHPSHLFAETIILFWTHFNHLTRHLSERSSRNLQIRSLSLKMKQKRHHLLTMKTLQFVANRLFLHQVAGARNTGFGEGSSAAALVILASSAMRLKVLVVEGPKGPWPEEIIHHRPPIWINLK